MQNSYYQLGGSLTVDAPSYVERQADLNLYNALKRGEFCYVLNTRQMGKSSLLVRTKSRLQQEGFRCTSIDLTRIGSENITSNQWYKGVVGELWRGFNLISKVPLKSWWREEEAVSVMQRLSYFVEDILLEEFDQDNLIVFVDEIDSVLSLDFTVDDFFAWIRFCYNQRAINPKYKSLSFALFGVATPSDLIQDKTRTPFNIGTAIELQGFTLTEAQPLAEGLKLGLSNIEAVLREVLAWTGGQPFLTQKICNIILNILKKKPKQQITLLAGMEEFWIEHLVQKHIISHWETQDEPEHLRTIRDRLLRNPQRTGRILGISQQLLHGISIPSDDSREQTELILSGLVIKQAGTLKIRNKIYQEVFNLDWVENQLNILRPYSQTFEAWIASDQEDESRLLRGQALKDAQTWARAKSLSDLDYQFLGASEELDRKEVQWALEVERTKEIEARLRQEQKAAKLQRLFLASVSIAFIIASSLGLITFWQYRRSVKSEYQARLSAIRAMISSAKSLFTSNQRLDGLVEAIRAKKLLQNLPQSLPELESEIDAVLGKSIYGVVEFNRFEGHSSNVNGVSFSPDGRLVSVSADKTLKLWRFDGTLLQTLQEHTDEIYSVQYSPNGEWIASAAGDNTMKLWDKTGRLVKTFTGHTATVWFVTFSGDSQLLATGSQDSTVKLWSRDGALLTTFKGHQDAVYGAAISPDQTLIASASTDGTAKVWRRDGTLLTTLTGHEGAVWAVTFSPDGEWLVTTGQDTTVRLWRVSQMSQAQTRPEKTLSGHQSAIWGVTSSPDGQFFVSSSVDQTAKVWNWQGELLQTLKGHQGVVWGVTVSPDSQTIATAGWDQTIRLWRRTHPLVQTIETAEDAVTSVDFSPTGDGIAASSLNGTVRLWQRDGHLLATLGSHPVEAWDVDYSSDGGFVVSSSADNTVKIWTEAGLQHDLKGHNDAVYQVEISPNTRYIASSTLNGGVYLWSSEGVLLHTFDQDLSRVPLLCFHPDSTELITANINGVIKIWHTETGDLLHQIETGKHLRTGSCSPDSQIVVTTKQQGDISLWDTQKGQLIKAWTSNLKGDSFLKTIQFSPDSQKIALSTWDDSLNLWSITLWTPEGTQLATLVRHQGEIRNIDFSPDGKQLVSGSFDKTINIWNLEQIINVDQLEFACDWVRDYLQTRSEVAAEDKKLCDGIGN